MPHEKIRAAAGDVELYTKEVYTYSSQDRLLTHTHQIGTGGTPQLLASNTYDELGQLIGKNVGNTVATPLQKINYAYNIRGWLTEINKVATLQQGTDPKDLFGFKINYNTIDGDATAANKLYNGNIAETSWSTSPVVRTYGYKYDNLNRLKDATYQKAGLITSAYDENLTYDKNGNILTLKRKGDTDPQMQTIKIDDLTYTYKSSSSNQLAKVSDNPITATSGFKDGTNTGDDYTYDPNGNLQTDQNKNITAITYNHLNLPLKVTFGTTGNITYIYNAVGQKVQKTVTVITPASTTITNYLGGYQYQGVNGVTPSLQFFPTTEGYVKNASGVYSYVFNYTDHLGNVRLSYSDSDKNGQIATTEILEESNYYPFGLKHNGYTGTNLQPGYKYKYNGKELQDELGLNTYAYGWRDYDPTIGRFLKIDRFAEKYMEKTPYNYAANNPIYYIDVAGDSIKVSFRTGFLGIFGKKQTLTYDSKNQQWNNEKGKQYSGKTSKFADRVLGDLKTNQKNELGNEIVSNLANDNIDHFVKNGDPNSNTINDPNIYYNGSVGDDGQKIYQGGKSGSSPGYVVFGHEMAHKYSRNLGVRNVPWFGAGTANARGVDEYNAMYYENVLRGANGLPLRNAYSENNGNLQGTILNSSGQLQSPPTLLSTQSAPTMPAVHAILIITKFINGF